MSKTTHKVSTAKGPFVEILIHSPEPPPAPEKKKPLSWRDLVAIIASLISCAWLFALAGDKPPRDEPVVTPNESSRTGTDDRLPREKAPDVPERERDISRLAGAPGDVRPTPPRLEIIPPPRFSSDGRFSAQLGAFRTRAAAQEAWLGIVSRAPSWIANAHVELPFNKRQNLHRIHAGRFATRTEALRFCAHMRRINQDCFVVE